MSTIADSRMRLMRWHASGYKGNEWFGRVLESKPVVSDNPYLSNPHLISATISKKEDGWWCDHVRIPDDLQNDMETWMQSLAATGTKNQ